MQWDRQGPHRASWKRERKAMTGRQQCKQRRERELVCKGVVSNGGGIGKRDGENEFLGADLRVETAHCQGTDSCLDTLHPGFLFCGIRMLLHLPHTPYHYERGNTRTAERVGG